LRPPGVAAMRRLYTHQRSKARSRQMVFDLTLEQFQELTSANCYYCGARPFNVASFPQVGITTDYIYNGIDRIDNTKGYVLDSVRSCCKRCNFLKGRMPEEAFFEIVQYVAYIARYLRLEPRLRSEEELSEEARRFRHVGGLAR
jgi:hypothetical protein